MKKKDIQTSIYTYFTLSIITKPRILGIYGFLIPFDYMFDAFQVALILCLISYYLLTRVPSKNIILIFLIYLSIFVSTCLNRGDYRTIILATGRIISSSIFAEIMFSKHKIYFAKSLKNFLFFYILINFISIIIFPSGWYQSGSVNRQNWWLGNKNEFCMYLLPYLFLAFFIPSHKRFIDYLGVAISVLTSLVAHSSTCLAGVLVFFTIYIAKILFPKLFTAKKGLFVALSLCAMFVIFNLQYLFKFIIVNILKRDLTFTARTIIWEKAIDWFLTSPIYGVGLLSTKDIETVLNGYSHPHCAYLYFLLFGGAISFSILLIYFIYVTKIADETSFTVSIAFLWSIFIIWITDTHNSRPELFYMIFTIIVNQKDILKQNKTDKSILKRHIIT